MDNALKVPRAERQFIVSRPLSTDNSARVVCAGTLVRAAPHDLRSLVDQGLIKTSGSFNAAAGSYSFHITPLGYNVAEELRQRGEPQDAAEQEAQAYLDSEGFRAARPDAHAKLRSARDLMASDPVENATRIGHDCREALMSFAASLADQHGVALDARPEQTVRKVSAVVDHHRAVLGDTTVAFLDALIAYWGTVSDLAQRQEHGVSKRGEPLGAEDARRVVFYTGLVMYELDRSIGAR